MAVSSDDVAGYEVATFAKGPPQGKIAPIGSYARECCVAVTGIDGTEHESSLIDLSRWHDFPGQLYIKVFNVSGEALTDFKIYEYVDATLAAAASLAADKVDILEKFDNYLDATDVTTLAGGGNVMLSHAKGDFPSAIKLALKATTDCDVTYIVGIA
jgi:hypothetical protein